MNLARRILLSGVPDTPNARPHHGCAAGMWVWLVAGAVAVVVGLIVGACCAQLE